MTNNLVRLACCSALATLLAAPFSQADSLGISGGKTVWQAELTGEAQSQTSRAAKQKPVDFNRLALTNEYYSGFWLELEHPLPILPNLRLAYTNIESAKRIHDKTTYPQGDFQYSTEQDVDTALTFDNLDATFYYQVLDNWVNLDLGVTARKLDGYLDVYYELSNLFPLNFPHSTTKLHQIVPMLYSKVQLDIPGTSIYLQASGNGIGYDSNTFYDFDAKVGGSLSLIPGIDLGLALGYRVMKLQIVNIGNLYADAQMQGWQGEFTAHF